MRMIQGSGTIANYASFVSNYTKNQFTYRVPVSSLADVQLYIDIGAVKPSTITYELIHTCGPLSGTVETVMPSSYVVGQDKLNNWYGVFKNFTGTADGFVIAITVDSQIYFSEEYCVEKTCTTLTELKGCYGNLDPLLSRDCDNIYFGYHSGTGDPLGDTLVKYEHQLLIRQAEVSVFGIKNTFKQGRTRNFRTEKEKIYQFIAEFIPEWYLSEIDAVFYRGEVYIGGVKYLVNETEFEKIDECKRTWKPTSSLKESCYKSFSCEDNPCAPPAGTCCDPQIISIDVSEVQVESGFPESGIIGSGIVGTTSGIVVIQAVIGKPPSVSGTFELVTGLTAGSSTVVSNALIGQRVYVERGNVLNPGIDPEDGSQWHTKNDADNFITFSSPFVTGEFIYIETIPTLPSTSSTPPSTSPPGPTAFKTVYWMVEGKPRSAMVWQPAGTNLPILFAWHGRDGTGTGFAQKHFEQYEFTPDSIIVVYPNGLPTLSPTSSGWQHSVGEVNPYSGVTDQDLKFYDAMLDTFGPYINSDFIFNHGFSNGGEFVYDVLWVARESTLESVVCASSLINTTSGKSPLPVMHIAGQADPLVSFSAQQSKFDDIKTLNGCSGSGTTWASGVNGVLATQYLCTEESIFLQHDQGHSYPSNVPQLISRFFNERLSI